MSKNNFFHKTENSDALSFSVALQPSEIAGNMTGGDALRLAKEISKLPDGYFTIAFYPYNRTKNKASGKLTVKERCKYRAQLPQERFQVDSDNYFLFSDEKGEPKTCYRILIRYMGFPHDNYKLHKINWL